MTQYWALIVGFILCTHAMIGQDHVDRVWILGNQLEPDGPSSSLFLFSDDTFDISPLYREWGYLFSGTIAIASREGPELWAYSNGCSMFNRKLELMTNGDSIVAGQMYKGHCTFPLGSGPYSMGAVLVPWPGTSDSLLLFNLNLEWVYDGNNGFVVAPDRLHYSVIDMSLDDGYGDVVVKRHTAIADTLARGHVRAVRHANGEDWWIVVPRSQSDCYYSLPVTAAGIGSPVYTCTGKLWGDVDAQGQATFSPDHKRYARINGPGGLHVFQFDPATGQMSYEKGHDFADETFHWAGTAFSPSGRYLYATTRNKLWQFDLEAADFEASRILIAERDPVFQDPFTARFYLCVLAPDGRIYIGPSGQFNYLQQILSPDCPGQACHFVQNHIKMFGSGFHGMPNIPFTRDWSGHSGCDTTTHTAPPYAALDAVVLYPNPVRDFLFVKRTHPDTGMRCVITSMTGQEVMVRELGEAYDTGLYVGELHQGMYIVSIISASGHTIHVDRVVKVQY
jgi:hypothetical protein